MAYLIGFLEEIPGRYSGSVGYDGQGFTGDIANESTVRSGVEEAFLVAKNQDSGISDFFVASDDFEDIFWKGKLQDGKVTLIEKVSKEN